jgi:putative cardiolipin synthase
MFNPFAHRGARGLDFIANFGRVNHRMHNKPMVIDNAMAIVGGRKDVFVGSFNLDPRSADINTEAGLYIESPELAAQMIAWMDEGVLPQNSYRVLLDEDGDLQWVTEYDGRQVRFDKDPESTGWQRFVAGFIGILPLEGQL